MNDQCKGHSERALESKRIEDEVLKKIKPTDEERAKVVEVVKRLVELVNSSAKRRGLDIRPILVGSVAKGTYMKGPDIDLFMAFPKTTTREELESEGLLIGKEVLHGEERYAEHPYIHGFYEGFDVDLVPCYAIESTAELMSAVDRTPFHTDYVKSHLSIEHADDVLLLKRFLKGLGIYGAEAEVQGFSGYLCELFVIRFGSFHEIVKHARRFKKGTRLAIGDVPGSYFEKFTDPLIFIDPVDYKRNVASPVSLDNFLVFAYACERYHSKPEMAFFYPPSPIISERAINEKLARRGTRLVGISTARPDIVADNLFSQLKRAEKSLRNALGEHGFRTIRSAYFATDKVIILFELENWQYSSAKKHHGPDYGHGNEASFVRKWKESPNALSKPYIENGVWTVEIAREFTTPEEFLANRAPALSLGKNISEEVKKGFKVIGRKDVDTETLAQFYRAQFRWEEGE